MAFTFTDLSNKALIQRVIHICDQLIADKDNFAELIQFFESRVDFIGVVKLVMHIISENINVVIKVSKNRAFRPTKSIVREAVFNIIGLAIQGASF